jgi:hypothetical protein
VLERKGVLGNGEISRSDELQVLDFGEAVKVRELEDGSETRIRL